jgi:hypothetical protein
LSVRITKRRRRTSELLYNTYEFGIGIREGELLYKSATNRIIKTISKYRDFVNVWLVLASSLVKNAFKFGYIRRNRVSALFKSE